MKGKLDWCVEEIAKVRHSLLKEVLEWTGEDFGKGVSNKITYKNYLVDDPIRFEETIPTGMDGIDIPMNGDFNMEGGLPCSSKIKNYIASETQRGLSPAKKLPANLVQRGKTLANGLIALGYSKFAAACIAAACMQESACQPRRPEPTELRKWGWKDAGEGLCGITFWKTKLACIKNSGVNLPTNPVMYEKGPHISDCSWDDHVKLLVAYIRTQTPKYDNIFRTSTNADEIACASFNFKAGPGRRGANEWEKMLGNVQAYKTTHARYGYKVRNLFTEQMKNLIDILE